LEGKECGPKRVEVTGDWRVASLLLQLTRYDLGYQIKEDELGRMFDMYGGEEKCIQKFLWGNLKNRNQLEDLGRDGLAILKWI